MGRWLGAPLAMVAGPLAEVSVCSHFSSCPSSSSPQARALSSASKFEAELKAEQHERKREEEERRLRQAAFRELKATFST